MKLRLAASLGNRVVHTVLHKARTIALRAVFLHKIDHLYTRFNSRPISPWSRSSRFFPLKILKSFGSSSSEGFERCEEFPYYS